MAEFSFEDVKSVVDEIAAEEGIKNYKLIVKEEEFTGGNYLSKIVRTQINEDGDDARKINLIIKLTVIKEEAREKLPAEKFFETELTAYKFILPELCEFQSEYNLPRDSQFKFAKFYIGTFDYLKEYVIMEDLSSLGYDLFGKDKPLDYEHSSIVMRTLANFHALSFAMKEKDPERFSRIKSLVADEFNYPDVVFSMVVNLPKVIIPHIDSKERSKALDYLIDQRKSAMVKCLDSSLTEPYNTICHGDLWNNNMLFKKQDGKDSDCIFVDYQFMRYATPATDIMYNFYMSTEGPFREKHFKELCDEYYSTLEKNLKHYELDVGKIYPRDVFYKHLEHAAPFAILFGLIASALLLTKSGEERKLEEWVDDSSESNFTLTDAMITRVEGLADDIIKYVAMPK